MPLSIVIQAENECLLEQAHALAKTLDLPLYDDQTPHDALLLVTEKGLALQLLKEKGSSPICVDFLHGPLAHRRQYGGGRNQLLARAVGLPDKKNLSILDLTAGLGRDGFVLATLGCRVTLIERQPIIAALLRDGLKRAEQALWFHELHLKLIETDAKAYLQRLASDAMPDVIYLDPMYPERKKSALVKKEMRILRELVGDDCDASDCLALALSLLNTKQRVVVKRPRLAPALHGPQPTLVFPGKSSRFDVYCGASFKP